MISKLVTLDVVLNFIKNFASTPANYEKLKAELGKIIGNDDLIGNLQKMKSVPSITIDRLKDDSLDCTIIEDGLYYGIAGGVQAELEKTHEGKAINIPHEVLFDLKTTIDGLIERANLAEQYEIERNSFTNIRNYLANAPHNSINALSEFEATSESVKFFIQAATGIDLNPDEINYLWRDIFNLVDVYLFKRASGDNAVAFFIGNDLIAFNASTTIPKIVILPYASRSNLQKSKFAKFIDAMKEVYDYYENGDSVNKTKPQPDGFRI